jgi:TatD DNase family protein
MELIDTHCHLTFDRLIENIDAVIARSIASGVTKWITVGTDRDHNRKALALAERFENLYAALGIHPHDAKDAGPDTFAELKELATHPKVVAIGETGLDFHYDFSPPEDQKRVFARHLEIAADLELPVIVHSREAFDDTLIILQDHAAYLDKVVFHCFTGSGDQAQIILDKGFHISFTGVVTFKNAHKTAQAAKEVPLDRLMVETDCPYMSPEPVRKQKTNEPARLIHTANYVAQLKNTDLPNFAAAVTATTKAFFNIS